MKKFWVALLICASVNAQTVINSGTSGITTPTGTLKTYTMGDDGHVQVPLQFGFPLYNKVFTNSVMYDNGVVGFYAPATTTTSQVGCDPSTNGYCGPNSWSAQQLTTSTQSSWNYTIAPLHSDLRPVSSTVYSTQGDSTQMTYRWQNIGEYYNPSNLSTFNLQIKPSGFIGVQYDKVNLGQSNVMAGVAGDLSKGEYAQHYYKPAGTVINSQNNMIPNWNIANTGADQCVVNPLSSPTCAGYTEAMCVANPLYSTTCSGYQQAYLQQQCSIDTLYSPNCPGYATAYLNLQCSLDPLYSTTCSGYEKAYLKQQCTINPLYDVKCDGYQTAYKDQQCTANPLYATDCPGYATAYLQQQCSINPLYSTSCSGYAAAYKSQQCSISALYATDCPGYDVAYKSQQCTANPLYATDCPGYADAYFKQQCSLNGLYDTKCPNYGSAYATLQALQPKQETASTTTTTSSPAAVPSPTTSSDGTVSIPVVKDSNVNNVINTTATSASPAQAATATVPLVQTSSPAAENKVMAAVVVENKQDDKKTEEKKSNDSSTSSTTTTASTGNNSSDSKSSDQPKSARQELQERRESAAKAKAVESAKNLANEMGKAANMESQAAVQNVVIAAMGYSPAFEAYKVRMPDVPGYKPYSIYKNQTNVDNRRLGYGLFGATDKIHSDMVESQYNKGN